MEQQLIELLLVAKKALSTGQAMGEQANILFQQSEQHADTIEQTGPKLVFVHNHILAQISTLGRIQEFLSMKTKSMRSILEDYEGACAKVTLDLQSIFRLLQSCVIDPGILVLNQQQSNSETSTTSATTTTQQQQQQQQHATTLFDYIQDRAVLELQRNTDDEIGQLEMLCISVETLSKQLSNQISELDNMQENALCISLDESTTNFANAKTHIQESEMTAMAAILTGLTNHYDQLGDAIRICQASPETSEELDITVLQEDHDHLPDILNDLRESMDIVDSVREEIQVRMQIYTTVQNDLLKVLDQLDQFSAPGGLAEHIAEKVIHAEAGMKTHETNLDHNFEQLISLTEWYQQFTYSYHHLIVEVERRRKVAEKQESWRIELLQKLETSYQEEVKERQRWVTDHGHYLPQDLCAFIFDPPSKLTVVKEQDIKPLPRISNDTIQKALDDVRQQQQQQQQQGSLL